MQLPRRPAPRHPRALPGGHPVWFTPHPYAVDPASRRRARSRPPPQGRRGNNNSAFRPGGAGHTRHLTRLDQFIVPTPARSRLSQERRSSAAAHGRRRYRPVEEREGAFPARICPTQSRAPAWARDQCAPLAFCLHEVIGLSKSAARHTTPLLRPWTPASLHALGWRRRGR